MSIGDFVSSEFQGSVLSKVAEWKPFFKLQSFQEKQKSIEASEMQQQLSNLHEELVGAKEDRIHALEEVTKLKKIGKSAQSTDKIKLIEWQAEKAKESERKMLESMVHQTKQLEQTKMSLEEAKLEIRNLQESLKQMEYSADTSHGSLDNKESLEFVGTQEAMKELRNDLRLALEAEEKSRRAMDDFAVALKEATSEANQAKAALAIKQSDLQKTREETESNILLLKSNEKKLIEALNSYDRMKLEYEESLTSWMEKENKLLSSIRISEEELTTEKQENSRMIKSWKAVREENTKLREIIKQAVNEAVMVKELLEDARNENSQLKNHLFEKETALQQVRQDYDSLKVSEAAALDCVRELKNMLASSSAPELNKSSNAANIGSFRLSKTTINNTKMNKCLKIFPSERWKPDFYPVNHFRRRSVGEPGLPNGSLVNKKGSNSTRKTMHNSASCISDSQVPLFSNEKGALNLQKSDQVIESLDTEKETLKKKKTILGRLGGTLGRKSIHN